MKVAIGADHRGFELKESLKRRLEAMGAEVIDTGAHSQESCDYPDYALAVGEAVSGGDAQRGVLVCASGIGVSIAANKVTGVRAALVHTPEEARLSRQHNDANVLCLGAGSTAESEAAAILEAWMNAEFEGGRHARRIKKVTDYENGHRE